MATAGQFTLTKTGHLSYGGSAIEYMEEEGNAKLDALLRGENTVFNQAFLTKCPDVETAIVVWLQTDYAAWKGNREIAAMSSRTR